MCLRLGPCSLDQGDLPQPQYTRVVGMGHKHHLRPIVGLDRNDSLWLIRTCRYRFSRYNKGIFLVCVCRGLLIGKLFGGGES